MCTKKIKKLLIIFLMFMFCFLRENYGMEETVEKLQGLAISPATKLNLVRESEENLLVQ